jgi:hypothetical protein
MRIRWTPTALDDFKTISHRIEQQRNLPRPTECVATFTTPFKPCGSIRTPAGQAPKRGRENS